MAEQKKQVHVVVGLVITPGELKCGRQRMLRVRSRPCWATPSPLLRQYGRDVEGDDRVTRCFATDEFFVATYAVEPGLALYQISQHADGENISQVFVATWHYTSGTPDLRLYRDGPWRRRFRSFADDSLDPAPPQLLHL